MNISLPAKVTDGVVSGAVVPGDGVRRALLSVSSGSHGAFEIFSAIVFHKQERQFMFSS